MYTYLCIHTTCADTISQKVSLIHLSYSKCNSKQTFQNFDQRAPDLPFMTNILKSRSYSRFLWSI